MEIPGYTIEREIGRGGMARVYLGEQRKLGRLVAIKVVSPEFTNDASFGKRFAREARIIAQLNHPNIVQVHDAGVHDEIYYLVMEYLRGGDLNRRLGRGMHMQAVIGVIKDMAQALNYAHEKGYVHRDIKPENILFREDGSAVLSDFGIAKLVTAEGNMTRNGTIVGTPQYMSPEQAAGRNLDGRADLYSLGVVIYRMLTGDVPYKADTAVAVGIRHLQDPIPRLPDHLQPFQGIIDKILAKNPDDRYQTGNELNEALDAIRADGLVPNRVIKTEIVTTAEIRAVTDVAASVIHDPRAIRAEPGHQRRNTHRSSRRSGVLAVILLVVSAGAGIYLIPDREQLMENLLFASGLVEDPSLQDAWREAQSLHGDPNQSLAAIAAAYRRVLSLSPADEEARAALDSLAAQWKVDIDTALVGDDLALAKAKLDESLSVFPNDEQLTALFDRLADQERAVALVSSTEALLTSHGLDDLASATAAIQAYQEVLRLDPGNPTATAQLDRLADRYVLLARGAADAGDVASAMNFLERATTANAEFQGLADMRDQIQQATTIQAQIQALLQRASQYRTDGALMNPSGENAAEIYHRVLATDPENAIAQQSLSQIVAEILSRATRLLSEGDLEAVRALGARASEIGLSAAAIEQMQQQLQTEEQRVADTARLLAEARELLDDGFITEPGEGNAVARLLDVLALDPGNADAGELLNKAAGRLAEVASEAYDAGLVDEAKHYLELALAVTPDVEAWRQLRARWELESATREAGA